MRSILAVAVLAAAGAGASAEELKDISLPTRYGITPSPEFYPQGTAKETLATAAKLIEKGRYAYILAYVIDPAFVDAQVAARARQLTPAVEKRLGERRAEQRRGLTADIRPEDVVPTDPVGFAEKVQAEAERLAFDGLVKAFQENLSEFPENVTQLAAISRDGVIAESGPAATAEAKAVPNKKVFLKQLDVVASKESRVLVEGRQVTRQDPTTIQRWFLEDRQAETEKADKPKAEK